MQKNTMIAITAVAILLIAGAGVAYALKPSEDPHGDITVTDMRDRTVTVHGVADDLVCLSASSLRLISYFGSVGDVVGIDDKDGMKNVNEDEENNYYMATYRIAYDSIKDIPCVGSESNVKDIMATGADVIFSSLTAVSELDDLQTKTGIPVIGLKAEGNFDLDNMDLFSKQLKLIGKVLGKEQRAGQLIDGIDGFLEELESYGGKVAEADRASAYVGGMFYFMKGGLYKTTGHYLPFDFLGIKNVMPYLMEGNPYDTSLKDVALANPGYMFIDSMTYKGSEEQFMADLDTLRHTDAVKNGNVITTFVYKYYGTNWDTEIINAFIVGSFTYPEVCGYSLEDKADAVLDLFYPDSDITYVEMLEKQAPNGIGMVDWF